MKSYYALILIGVLLWTGCDSDNASDDSSRVSLSVGSTFALSGAPKSGSHVALTDVKILVSKIHFHSRDDADTDSLDFRSEPLVIHLTPGSSLNEIVLADVPAGTFHKITFEIHKPGENETPPDLDFKIGQSGLERFTVIAAGVSGGSDFVYRSSKAMHQTVTLEEDLVISGSEVDPLNVTLTVDVSSWFIGQSGEELDPFSTSSSMQSHIDKSIRESFRIFKDQDRNGARDN